MLGTRVTPLLYTASTATATAKPHSIPHPENLARDKAKTSWKDNAPTDGLKALRRSTMGHVYRPNWPAILLYENCWAPFQPYCDTSNNHGVNFRSLGLYWKFNIVPFLPLVFYQRPLRQTE